MKKFFFSLLTLILPMAAFSQETYSGTVVADEGAWCWFADPRALHYENEGGTINATYIGYIDVHGNVKATQYDWVTGRKTDVLIRSYFQPDDHNNPTFVVLPDERVMIFYTRHTDEAKIWYRISQKPGDITALGEEKYLATANNTTYPSPFILSDDPNHIYLCWRGINWHPTIARLTMPDASDNCSFDFGPKQIVQSTGSRPYAKYQSNGKDKIYLSYTTGHPDNEMPDWLYFNVIDINHGNGPILRDIKGNQLSVIANGVHNVNKQSSYASAHPAAIVDNTAGIRNWVWQITLDENENPVIAYPHIDDAKTTHVYWYARWTGSEWRRTWVQYGGHAFHKNWNSTERCYSGGMAVDPDHVNDLYLSIPTTNGQYNKDGVYEIWKYTIDDEGKVAGSEQITRNSEKNNVRPFIIPGSKNSKMRLAWMNGDYYYWMVQKAYPKGYPTGIRVNYAWEEELTPEEEPAEPRVPCVCFANGESLVMAFAMDENNYEGTLFEIGDTRDGGHVLTYSLGTDNYPVMTINGKSYKSQNRLLTSDNWATGSSGTGGDNHPTKVTTWVFAMTYDGQRLITYRNGLVDQVIETTENLGGDIYATDDSFHHTCLSIKEFYGVASPVTVQSLTKDAQDQLQAEAAKNALLMLDLPTETRTDLVLPASRLGLNITWTSDNEQVISNNGVLYAITKDKDVTLTATIGEESREFPVKALARDITKNVRYTNDHIDLTANTASGFSTNTYVTAPQGLLTGLRSYTVLLTATPKTMTKQPRLYDFGSASGNSLFLRADALAAGIKYNGGTTTMVSGATTLKAGTTYKMAVTYDAATRKTTIYINGEVDASGVENQNEPYMLAEIAPDTRNYIGRTQWWDGNVAADNQDFCGTIDGFSLYDVCLTQKEICTLQDIPYEEKEYPTTFVNGDFEDTYSVMSGSGVTSDRAIYVPKGWTLDYGPRDANDFNALAAADKQYSSFFAGKAQNSKGGQHTLWMRQRWGASILNYYQEVLLAAGKYQLTADLFATDNSSNNTASVYVGGVTRTVSALNQWQTVTIDFEADGVTPVIIGAKADHKANEFICGFDNFVLTLTEAVGVSLTPMDEAESSKLKAQSSKIYTLAGQQIEHCTSSNSQLPKGVYIVGGKKVVRK